MSHVTQLRTLDGLPRGHRDGRSGTWWGNDPLTDWASAKPPSQRPPGPFYCLFTPRRPQTTTEPVQTGVLHGTIEVAIALDLPPWPLSVSLRRHRMWSLSHPSSRTGSSARQIEMPKVSHFAGGRSEITHKDGETWDSKLLYG